MVSINYWDIVQKAISIALGFYFGLVFFSFDRFVRSLSSCRFFLCCCCCFFFFFFCAGSIILSVRSLCFRSRFIRLRCTVQSTLHYCHISCCDFSWFDCSVGFADGRYHMKSTKKTHMRTHLIADVFDSLSCVLSSILNRFFVFDFWSIFFLLRVLKKAAIDKETAYSRFAHVSWASPCVWASLHMRKCFGKI